MVVYEFVPVLPCGGVDPAFLFMCFHSMVQLDFYLKMIFFLENDLESPFIFVLFLKGK